MQNSPHHHPVVVQRNFRTNLLFELCLFDCSARPDGVRSSGWWQEWCPFPVCRHMRAAFVCRMPQQTCCRPRLLRSPFVRVELPSSGAVCSRPAVSVPFSIAFITDLTNIKACNSTCDCRFARFASAERWRQFKDSSSWNNCCFKKVQRHVSLSKNVLPGWGGN